MLSISKNYDELLVGYKSCDRDQTSNAIIKSEAVLTLTESQLI